MGEIGKEGEEGNEGREEKRNCHAQLKQAAGPTLIVLE